jgi:transposase
MIHAEAVRRVRRWRSVSEKRQIVQLTLEPGASVAEVARAHGVNANQVFKWRRAFERGELNEPCSALLPIAMASVSEPASDPAAEEHVATAAAGSIHIELPGIAMISVESGADSALVRQILESLRQ